MKHLPIHKLFLITVLCITFFNACKKEDNTTPPVIPVTTVVLGFAVDNSSFLFDTIAYTNAAGNKYSVSRLQFYLSAFEFENTDGTLSKFDTVCYVDAGVSSSKSFALSNLPAGNYKRMKFLIGLDSLHNVENGLPNTLDNYNMVWPAPMGGGYHFMKMEGTFLVDTIAYGFAMHVGKNQNKVTINIVKNFSIGATASTLNLKMNLNEWFTNPSNYDFNIDGNYSMADSAAMAKLTKNGTDVFTLN